MPRGKEVQERIQTVIEKVKTLHERQHLTHIKQRELLLEQRGDIINAKKQGKETDDQVDSDYSNEDLSSSGLLLVRHLPLFDALNEQQVQGKQHCVTQDY